MTPITVGLKDEVAWIEDNMFDERPEHLKIKNTINGQGQQWPCFFYPTFDTCYVSVVLKVDSEPVISFFNKDKLFEGLPFLIFDANFIIYSQFNLTSLSIIKFLLATIYCVFIS